MGPVSAAGRIAEEEAVGDVQPLAFQLAPAKRAPAWPEEGALQSHLDLEVDDLDAGEAAVLEAGATKHEHQPGESFRVFLDPEGNPFCLVRSAP